MRLVFALLGMMAFRSPSFAQNFPLTLVTNDNALACKDSEKITMARLALEKKDPRALRRTGCRQLRGGMQVSVLLTQRVDREDYKLVCITWRHGPELWA